MSGTVKTAAPVNQHDPLCGPQFRAMLERVETRNEAEARRGIRAWLLAPTIPIYLALMRGERVPIELLIPDALHRYGIKR